MGWFFVGLVERGVLKRLFFLADIPEIPDILDFLGGYGFSKCSRCFSIWFFNLVVDRTRHAVSLLCEG